MEKVRLNFFLSENLYEDLKKIAQEEGRTISDAIRQAIIEYIKNTQEYKKQKLLLEGGQQ